MGLLDNIFKFSNENFTEEQFVDIIKTENVRIEKIVSNGHISPSEGWYDQDENEWVIVLEGSAKILLEDSGEHLLNKGDYINIPAHSKHKVTYTQKPTIWLAVFYK